MKILNLYAGLGGNRKLWDVPVTSVENNPIIAEFLSKHFKEDIVICADAHEILLKHHRHCDFIWSSPPCQSHSSFRQNICVRFRGTEPVYPDMRLWQEILFLQHNAKCKWVVENVKPYYKPLIEPTVVLGRHYFWSNFDIPKKDFKKASIRTDQIKDLELKHGYDLSGLKIPNKRQVLRNCVDPEIGKYILDIVKRGK